LTAFAAAPCFLGVKRRLCRVLPGVFSVRSPLHGLNCSQDAGGNPTIANELVMAIDSYAKDDILTIRILDERLIDPEQLKRLFDDLYALLGKSEQQQVVVDFSSVKFMASAMLGKLVAMKKKCDEYRAKLKLCSVAPEILEVFKITKLNKVFDIQSDDATARKSFNKRGFFG
jgi:anti-anti-sigma factor